MLPIDILRPILAKIDEEALINLFETMDRTLSSLLVHPYMITSLNLLSLSPDRKILARYFMWAIRNVEELHIDDECLNSIHDLTTLNPRHLELRGPDASLSTHERRMAYLYLPKEGLPNFATLTPRLVTLDLTRLAFSPIHFTTRVYWKNPTFPPTLTAFSCPYDFKQENLLDLPSDLSSLTITGLMDQRTLCLMTLFNHMTRIERLSLDRCSLPYRLPPELSVPTTLTSIKVRARIPDDHASDFFSHAALEYSRITSIVSIARPFEPLEPYDFHCNPKTLTSLTFFSPVGEYYYLNVDPYEPHHDLIANLPVSLLHLSINLSLLRSTRDLDLTLLTLLDHFEITEDIDTEDKTPINFYLLPRLSSMLRTLVIRSPLVEPLTSVEIEILPRTLTSLQILSFDDDALDDFDVHLPECDLILIERIPLVK